MKIFYSIKYRLLGIFQKPFLRNTLWMLLAQVLGLAMQAAYFLIIARTLGTQQYGVFVGVTALASIVFPFASLGSGDILIKKVSINRAFFKEYWGNALLTVFIFSLILSFLGVIGAQVFFPKIISPLLIFFVLLSDLLCLTIWDLASKAFIAVHLVKMAAQLKLLLNLNKLIFAFILVAFFQKPTITLWTILYFLSTGFTALVSYLLAHRMLGSPKLAISRIKPEILQGFYFSVSESAATINASMDQAMLVSLSTLKATGIYAAAYRFVDVGIVPLHALLATSYAKFFQEGATGISGSLNFAKRLLPILGTYGVAASTGLFVLAPVLPYVLGNEYAGAVEALRWLAPIPFILALQFLAADTLTGSGFQGVRSGIQITAALLNILLNLWLIPLYSWKGAAWSTLASDSLKLLSLWAIVVFFYRQQAQNFKENQ